MIISKTPYRISFFGGGTDYPAWYKENGGAFLSTSINHYVYITCRYLPPFFKHKSRISWSKVEEVASNHEIQHPAVKAILEKLNVNHGVEVHYDGDLPARSGVGSSSSFSVGLLHALRTMYGETPSKYDLSKEAIEVEQIILNETVGIQDQIAASFGGLNHVIINKDGSIKLEPILIPAGRIKALEDNFLLMFTGVSRTASDIANKKVVSFSKKKESLYKMMEMVKTARSILEDENVSLDEFGKLLHETWLLKQSLSSSVAPGFVMEMYEKALNAGALGGKLLGAGGGGFMLFYVDKTKRQDVLNALRNYIAVPFKFERDGTQIIFNHKTQYSETLRSNPELFKSNAYDDKIKKRGIL